MYNMWKIMCFHKKQCITPNNVLFQQCPIYTIYIYIYIYIVEIRDNTVLNVRLN